MFNFEESRPHEVHAHWNQVCKQTTLTPTYMVDLEFKNIKSIHIMASKSEGEELQVKLYVRLHTPAPC